jgi:hypothetical protein
MRCSVDASSAAAFGESSPRTLCSWRPSLPSESGCSPADRRRRVNACASAGQKPLRNFRSVDPSHAAVSAARCSGNSAVRGPGRCPDDQPQSGFWRIGWLGPSALWIATRFCQREDWTHGIGQSLIMSNPGLCGGFGSKAENCLPVAKTPRDCHVKARLLEFTGHRVCDHTYGVA